MKKYTRNYIEKGTKNNFMNIIKVTIKMAEAGQFIYEKDGNLYLINNICPVI